MASTHTKFLPFGAILTPIFKHFNVDLSGEPFIKIRPFIYIVEKKYAEKPSSSSMTDGKRLKTNLNIKAMNALICGLTPNEYNRVSTCATAHEIWEKLCITHEGISQVKESKISGLMHDYELFKMLQNESIDAMFSRFTNIINELHGLDKKLSNQEMNYKIFRSLTPV
ncbi:uncharacterized protein LOC109841619 [Asparagus officinalis]|uniref:uncharacterized protein LOC109841619 n=1 Tax=Asparagus officinalis TaxID=4686 RepID=UPI00098DF57E|nr:uncharacterized protein LOC109841619 [Asparagus officinalis]